MITLHDIEHINISNIGTTTKHYNVVQQKNNREGVYFRSLIFFNSKLKCMFPFKPMSREAFKIKVDISKCVFEENN